MESFRSLTIIVLGVLSQVSLPADQLSVNTSGVAIVNIGENKPINEMAVFPSEGITGRPLLIAAHGNGSSGPKEIKEWLELARQHNFTIVCPTFLSAVQSIYVPDDATYFAACLRWIEGNLRYDKENVFMTGFSGGGYAVWYLGINRPDFFRGVFLQSGNFAGLDYYKCDLSFWVNKPIRLIWGEKDSPTVTDQNREAMDLIQSSGLKDFSSDVIPGAHHEPHRDMVVTWMESKNK